MRRAARLVVLAAVLALAPCDRPPDVCGDNPPSASEFRAICTKNGRPDDCGEALDLCRNHDETPATYCRRICADGGAPREPGCTFNGKCILKVAFERIECSFCFSL